MNYKYPVYRPSLKGNEKKYVDECLDSTWISSKGKFGQKFEEEFSKYIDIKCATTVSNGTVALHLTLLALGISNGDEVIVPTLTYIASVNSISYTGATPVFVDSLKDTWQMDPKDIEIKITPRTKAIMVVHLYGHPCKMEEICRIAKKNNLFIIEDCAESFGSKYSGKYVGTFGDIAAFSFFGNKTVTTGEGGMVATNDKVLHERVVHFKGQGLAEHREYWHDVIGYNYRMTNICAAIGLAQLERADNIIEKKRKIAKWYQEYLKDLPVVCPIEAANAISTYWIYNILVENLETRDKLRAHLAKSGVETRPVFSPIHTMPMYSSNFKKYPVAEDIASKGISLPSYPDLEVDDIKAITNIVSEFFR